MTLKINLQKSVAEMLVLSILNNGTMYGYQLIQELEAQSKQSVHSLGVEAVRLDLSVGNGV